MKKKTTWAASVVKKQLQTCCKHETLSLETADIDDVSECFDLPPEIRISSPIKETPLPSLFRRKSFNVNHVKSLLTTPESQTPFRKSVESALPLYGASTLKPTRLQYVKSSPNFVEAVAEPTSPLPSPPPATKAKTRYKSGPLPVLLYSLKGVNPGGDHTSPLTVKKHLSGPLPSATRKPLSGTPSPCSPVKAKNVSGPLSTSGGKPRQVAGSGPPPHRLTKARSAHGLFPAVATSKLPGMVTQGTLKKAAQIVPAKVKQQIAPFLDRKDSRGSRASKGECNAPTPSALETSATKTLEMSLGKTAVTPVDCLSKKDGTIDVVVHYARLHSRNERRESNTRERDRVWAAAVKIQAAFRGYKGRKSLVFEPAKSDSQSGELEEEELEGAVSVSTRMSKTDLQKRKKAPPQVSKGWNGSIRTAQDCQALLRSKQEAALKRERAMEYALSRQHWKTGSRSQKGPAWITDDRLPDKPGWVWSWLERAARMGAHNSQNRIFDNFDNDYINNEPESESLSVKSTVGMCTTEIGSLDMDLGWPITNPWPLSLRQQHAAGLLQPKASQIGPSPLQKPAGTPETPLQRVGHNKIGDAHPLPEKKCHQAGIEEHCTRDVSTIADSSPTSEESLSNKPRYGVRKLKFLEHNVQNYDQESVGSCVGALPTLYRLSSPFTGTKVRSQSGNQHKPSNPNSLKEANRAHPLAQGQTQAHQVQAQVSVALSDSDSAGTTAASVRRPFWRP